MSPYAQALANPIAFPGGYTIRFWYPDGEVTCHACEIKAAAVREAGAREPRTEVYWEGPPLTCRDCGKELSSEYGNPEESNV